MEAILTIAMVAAVIIDIWIIYYLINLQRANCVCALGWRHTFVLFFWVASMLYTVAHVFRVQPVIGNMQLAVFMIAFSALNIWVVLSYISKLEREKCKCSEDIARDVIKVITIVRLFVYAFFAVILLYSVARIAAAVSTGNVPLAQLPKKTRRGNRAGKKLGR